MNMVLLSTLAEMALLQRRAAASEFIQQVTEKDKSSVGRLLGMALWRERDIQSFELLNEPVLAEGFWGRFWLAPDTRVNDDLRTKAPVLTPRGLRALAQGLVEILV